MRLWALRGLFGVLLCGVAQAQDRLPVPLLPQDRILILAPHPDDDILGCAGLIQNALEKKIPVHVAYLTNGDNYEWAFMAYKKRPVLTPAGMQQMGALRHDEATAAQKLLGVGAQQLSFFGYPDWGTERIFMEHWGPNRPAFRSMLTKVSAVPYSNAFRFGAPYKGESILQDLETILLDFKPTKVFVSHPADGHRDHRTFYLFAQVALWNLEDRMRPQLYPFLIHYPRWPKPRGLLPERSLNPPAYFQELAWTEQKLSASQIALKQKALAQHRTQMAKDSKYLDSFVADNELFSGYPDLVLGHEISKPAVETVHVSTSAAEVQWKQITQEGEDLLLRMQFSPRSHKSRAINMYAFGYRKDVPFASMPKIRLQIEGKRLRVFDQDRLLMDSGASMDRDGRAVLIRLPLAALGNPERFIGTAWSRAAEEPFDWRVWRVVDLRQKPIKEPS